MSENGEIYTAGKNFTLSPAVTGGTNLTSGWNVSYPLDCSDFKITGGVKKSI